MYRERMREALGSGLVLAAAALVSLLLILVIYYLYALRGTLLTIFFPFVVSLGAAYLLNPLLEFLCSRLRISRTLGIIFIYGVILLLVYLLFINTLPALAQELQKIIARVPFYTSQVQLYLEGMQSDYSRFNIPGALRQVIDGNIQELQDSLVDLLEALTHQALNFFSHIVLLVLIPLLVFYMLKDLDSIKAAFFSALPYRYRGRVRKMGEEVDKTLGAYIRGQLLISLLVGTMVYLGLTFLGVEFALVLAVINGITNIVPYFGPVIGAVPVLLLSLLDSPLLSLKVLLMLVVVQQVESHLLAPQILGRSLGIHPLLVILALLAGGSLAGFAGLILAVPAAAVARVMVKHLLQWRAG